MSVLITLFVFSNLWWYVVWEIERAKTSHAEQLKKLEEGTAKYYRESSEKYFRECIERMGREGRYRARLEELVSELGRLGSGVDDYLDSDLDVDLDEG